MSEVWSYSKKREVQKPREREMRLKFEVCRGILSDAFCLFVVCGGWLGGVVLKFATFSGTYSLHNFGR
ncbi:hypothetical protein T12_6907, partial [Trichinella patagoniensis]